MAWRIFCDAIQWICFRRTIQWRNNVFLISQKNLFIFFVNDNCLYGKI
jgi:hypothetical protein